MAIQQPIDFAVNVGGKYLIATLEESIQHPLQDIFRIKFSDGYVDDFLLDEETGAVQGDNKEASKLYARSLHNDMAFLVILDPKKFFHIFQQMIDGVLTNVWIIEKENEGNESLFGVYYNGFYRFELKKSEDDWVATTVSNVDEKIDQNLATRIGYLLHSLVS